MRHHTLLLALIAGCATTNEAVDSDRGNAFDTGSGDLAHEVDAGGPPFWLEVEPADELVQQASLLPQRFGPYLTGDGFQLALQPAVRVTGTVRADVLSPPWNAAPLPTQTVPTSAALRYVNDLTGEVSVARAEEDGTYDLSIVPALYTLTVVPTTTTAPVRHLQAGIFDAGRRDIALGLGVPLWGRVRDAQGAPVPNATITAVDPKQITSAATVTDDAGWYEIRVDPGVWRVRAQPPAGVRDPIITSDTVTLGDEGSRIDLAWGGAPRADLTLRLISPDGLAVDGVEVGLRSTLIDTYNLGQAFYEVTTTSNSQGFVDARLPEGIYRITVTPSSSQPYAPFVVDDVRIEGQADIGNVPLAGFSDLNLVVVDGSNRAIPDAPVRCVEITGLGRSWTGTSGASGEVSLQVPTTTVDCVVQPASSRSDLAATRSTFVPPFIGTTVQLTPGHAIAGIVTVDIRDNTRPAALSIVRVLDDDLVPLGYGLTDEEGRFTVRVSDDR